MTVSAIARRDFLRVTALAGGGLLLGAYATPARATGSPTLDGIGEADEFAPSAFIRINVNGGVTLVNRNPEAGQGMRTTIAMLIAEELEVDLAAVTVEQAPGDSAKFGRQFLGGSSNTPSSWDEMRRVGAAARTMLVTAASGAWNVPVSECHALDGRVHHRTSGRSMAYGELVARAAALPAPDLRAITLKPSSEHRIIGKPMRNVDSAAIVVGKPLFGIDVQLPGMLHATFTKCPVFGGKVVSANLEQIKAMPGVRHAFVVAGGSDLTGLLSGVAIVADRWYQARDAQQRLQVQWDEGENATHSSVGYAAKADELAKGAWQAPLRNDGDVDAAFAGAAKVIEGNYSYPLLAHVTMEPMNCTARFENGKLELWVPSQSPDAARQMVTRTMGIAGPDITINLVRMGGAFGRRFMQDFAIEAAWIAREAKAPIKLLWTREDDIRHDFYRPAAFHFLKGAVDTNGKVTAWRNHFVSFGSNNRTVFDGGMQGTEFPARYVPNFSAGMSLQPLAPPTGALRAPQGNAMSFVMQSFIDELAHAAGQDPLQFRLKMLDGAGAPTPGYDAARIKSILQLAADRAGWGTRKLPARTALGIAFHYSHRGYFAEVVEATVSADKRVKVNKVWAVGDIGSVIINPLNAEAQVQGSVIDGLGQAMDQEITIDKGRVVEGSFREFPIVRMRNAPPVDVFFHKTDNTVVGLGEPSLPPVIPALCNAIFAVTGERVRSLPLSKSGYRWA